MPVVIAEGRGGSRLSCDPFIKSAGCPLVEVSGQQTHNDKESSETLAVENWKIKSDDFE